MFHNQGLGKAGEQAAAEFLERKGFRILERNARSRLGELDLVAEDPEGVLCFVEVKTRTSLSYGTPQHAVEQRKMHHIARAATSYLKAHRAFDRTCRFDVVAVMPSADVAGEWNCEHIPDAFRL